MAGLMVALLVVEPVEITDGEPRTLVEPELFWLEQPHSPGKESHKRLSSPVVDF